MKDFMMIFRSPVMGDFKPSADQMQASIKKWQDWIGAIAAQGKFGSTNALGYEGKILKAGNTVVDGPYTELKEMVGGYIIVKEKTIDSALKLAEGCPVLEMGGHVEVRDIMVINPN